MWRRIALAWRLAWMPLFLLGILISCLALLGCWGPSVVRGLLEGNPAMAEYAGRLATNKQGRIGRITTAYRMWGGRMYAEGVGFFDGLPWEAYGPHVLDQGDERRLVDSAINSHERGVAMTELHDATWWHPQTITPAKSNDLWKRFRKAAGSAEPCSPKP